MTSSWRGAALVVAGVGLGFLAPVEGSTARAGDGMQVDFFEPLYGQGTTVLGAAKSDLLGHLKPSFGAFFHTSYGLIEQTFVGADGREGASTVVLGLSHKLELSAALGLFEVMDLGVTVPLVLDQTFENRRVPTLPSPTGAGTFSVQDVRLFARGRLLKAEDNHGFGLALGAGLLLPTGSPGEFTTDGSVRFEPRLIFDWRHGSGFLVGLNAGVQLRPRRVFHNIVNTDAFRWSAYTEIPLGLEDLRLVGDVFGTVPFEAGRDPADLSKAESTFYNRPMEALAGLRYWWREPHLVFQAGGGAGITRGMGAPAWRVFASVDWTPTTRDRDEDGILDEDDQCVDTPEDRDGFQDADGCPDPDNDQDGILDVDDKCPMDPEDTDGFQDADGCPDPDNDGDGLADAEDRCPNKPEDKDTYQDADGCPDPDNDGDKVLDVDDKCPNKPEDKDGFQDADGCPDPDNDKDGIPDVKDTCPLKPETVNQFQDEDGCPDDPKAKVQVTKRYITIKGKVNFATNKAVIKGKASFALLDEVAAVLKQYPQITKLRIEGHTDKRGPASYNLRLSDRRAAAVRNYLVRKGVDAKRLVSKGYGESRPKVPNTSKKNMAINRRTEFFILELNGKPVGADAKVEVPAEGGEK